MLREHEKYMGLALKQARLALDAGQFPVGCVMVRDGEILAAGQRMHSDGEACNEIDHAEVVTLRGLLAQYPGLDCSDVRVYSTMEPCLMCYTTMLLSGFRHFVWGYEDVMGGGTGLDLRALTPLYSAMTVSLTRGVRRPECLQLFREFFSRYSYWKGSLLERYTLTADPEALPPYFSFGDSP